MIKISSIILFSLVMVGCASPHTTNEVDMAANWEQKVKDTIEEAHAHIIATWKEPSQEVAHGH